MCKDKIIAKLFSPYFLKHPQRVCYQTLLAMGVMFFLLFLFGSVTIRDILGAIGASSLAGSVFIAFGLPDSAVAQPRRMLGAYVLSICIGLIFFHVLDFILQLDFAISKLLVYQIVGICVVGLTMFCMVLFDFEHPPATGMALGLVFDRWNHWTIVIVLISISCVVLVKYILRNKIKTLIERAE